MQCGMRRCRGYMHACMHAHVACALSGALTGGAQVVKMLARLHHRLGAPQRAIAVLEAHVREYAQSTDLTHINILAELYMEGGKYEETLALIKNAEIAEGPLPIRPHRARALLLAP